jgi:hypothetical protein
MKKEEFLHQLGQYAEFDLYKPEIESRSRGQSTRYPKNPKKIISEKIAEDTVILEDYTDDLDQDTESYSEDLKDGILEAVVDSHPPYIRAFKTLPKTCDDCGRQCLNRVVTIKQSVYPQLHWRRRCTSCKMTQNPLTGQFELEDTRVGGFFKQYFLNNAK